MKEVFKKNDQEKEKYHGLITSQSAIGKFSLNAKDCARTPYPWEYYFEKEKVKVKFTEQELEILKTLNKKEKKKYLKELSLKYE